MKNNICKQIQTKNTNKIKKTYTIFFLHFHSKKETKQKRDHMEI